MARGSDDEPRPSAADPVYVVFNPMSGKGRGAQFVSPLLQALSGAPGLDHGLTREPGDEARLTAEALARGFRRIVAVGGDGTWSNVGGAIVRSGIPAKLGLVPGGTGCDLAKSLGIPPRNLSACARIILDGHTRTIDVGRIEDRHFLNIAGFGYDVAVIEDSWNVGYLEGAPLYLYCAIRQLGSFKGFSVDVEADGRPLGRLDLLMLILANARVFGGGFQIAPRADLADGRLDAMAFGNMGFWPRARVMQRLLAGTHESDPHLTATVAASFRFRFDEPPTYETDGEWNRAKSTEVRVETLPKALTVLVPGP
jgi:YegS/Rv2252/BmrU family lipid kinase